jgi:hypothetical protein
MTLTEIETMNCAKYRGASLAIALLAGGVTMAQAGDACRNVKFSLTNQKDHAITVVQVKYFNQANNRFQTESLRNLTCAAGATCTTRGDNLRDAEGENLTRFIFVLKNEGGENRHETGVKVSNNPSCNADKTYGPFAITASD